MYLSITVKLVVGLVTLLAVTRLMGKKELSQVTPFDFIYAIILGGIVEESIYDEKVSPLHLAYSAALWGALIYTIEILAKKKNFFRSIFKGKESHIIADGKLNVEAMQKNHLEMEQLRTLLRQNGVFSVSEVKNAYLETSGGLSVQRFGKYEPITPEAMGIKAPENNPSILLVDEGEVVEDGLEEIGKDSSWLKEALRKEGQSNIKNIFCAEWSEEDGFYIVPYKS
ncbi:membrane protein [Mesobacillus campisalis]|uniref:Membrane protein n=1 Tax=Mesobacillus campisalis TaxID=1408103 RepID=A0A0M2SZZ8_9BACI|nr:DUF421 domain-containing protein [Mesobacillus campisalis]KKK39266.1 membrane protein [Mesobacillus campisalis]